jgi:putative nucleotidyltransferase with HDIG domain
MIATPLIVVWLTSQVLYFTLPTLSALVLSVVLSFLCATIASRIWEHRSKTAEISFSELMIWSWYRLQKAERKIERSLRAAETARTHDEQRQVLHELTAALESKDPYTRGHSRRVERHCFKTGVAMGLAPADVEVLRMSASLHDVGKIRVSNRVLHKAGALSAEERALIEEHPVLGANMVASVGDERIVEAVRHHHERWDGGGYPDGKAGTEIPLFGRVIAVADSYDAIRSNRSYRRGSSRDEAVGVLTEESGRQFDAEVVEAFLETLPARGRSVAALTSLATGPGALWRYLARLFQRFGSTALAPALGVAGTAVILGTSSLLTPSTPALASPMEESLRATVASGTSAPQGASATSDRDRILAEARADARSAAAQARIERRRAAQREERRAAQREKRRAAQREERRAAQQEGAALADTGGGSGSSTSPTSSAQEDPSTAPAPASDTSDGVQAKTGGDPNDEGKDCESRKRSKGYRLHCG